MTDPAPTLFTTPIGATPAARQRIVMLHGIYGRGRNWQAIAREVTAARPDWSALLVDLRLHGDSPAFDPPHTLQGAAEDVRRVIESTTEGAPPVGAVLGHSFGGKVALALGASPPSSVRQIWVVDATPGAHAPRGSAWDMLARVRSLPATFPSRADAVAALEAKGWPNGVATWMATNLRHADGAFRWMLDLDAMESLLHSYFETDLWSVIESPPPSIDLHVVKAQGSNTIDEAACARITAAEAQHGRVHLHRVDGTHWLNADNPKALVALLADHLQRL